MAVPERLLSIEVAYALPQRQTLLKLEVPAGTTLREAIRRSGLTQHHPELDLERISVGVFSRLAELDDLVGEGDRVEVYRPLTADPKDVRRRRAEQTRRR
jgi:putative ubiquitin-RnfH superfamily antitoxin RatB of RatAB toxin-antitoxin module